MSDTRASDLPIAIGDLADVDRGDPQDGDTLVFTAGRWAPAAPAEGGGGGGSPVDFFQIGAQPGDGDGIAIPHGGTAITVDFDSTAFGGGLSVNRGTCFTWDVGSPQEILVVEDCVVDVAVMVVFLAGTNPTTVQAYYTVNAAPTIGDLLWANAGHSDAATLASMPLETVILGRAFSAGDVLRLQAIQTVNAADDTKLGLAIMALARRS